MSGEIKISYDELNRMKTDLASVKQHLDSTEEFAARLANASGEDTLALRWALMGFSETWSNSRKDIAKAVEEIHKGVSDVLASWDKWDNQYGSQLSNNKNGAASSHAPRPSAK